MDGRGHVARIVERVVEGKRVVERVVEGARVVERVVERAVACAVA